MIRGYQAWISIGSCNLVARESVEVDMEIELRRLIGHQVVVTVPVFIDNEKLRSVKLLAVEEAGIWIESQEAVDKVIGRLQKKPSSAALAFFLSYDQIATIVAGFEPSGIE